MLHKARAMGLSALVLEAAPSVGGTWYANRYPGARVDIQSLESFAGPVLHAADWPHVCASRLRRLPCGRHRHGFLGGPGDFAHRAAGGVGDRVPAYRGLCGAGPQRPARGFRRFDDGSAGQRAGGRVRARQDPRVRDPATAALLSPRASRWADGEGDWSNWLNGSFTCPVISQVSPGSRETAASLPGNEISLAAMLRGSRSK